MTEPLFTVISARTDCLWHAVDGENLTEDLALALIVCNRKLAERKHLWTADGRLIPYLDVMRWFILPQPPIVDYRVRNDR